MSNTDIQFNTLVDHDALDEEDYDEIVEDRTEAKEVLRKVYTLAKYNNDEEEAFEEISKEIEEYLGETNYLKNIIPNRINNILGEKNKKVDLIIISEDKAEKILDDRGIDDSNAEYIDTLFGRDIQVKEDVDFNFAIKTKDGRVEKY